MIALLLAILALVVAGAALAIALFTRRETDENTVRLTVLEHLSGIEEEPEQAAPPPESRRDYSAVEDAKRARAARDAARGAR